MISQLIELYNPIKVELRLNLFEGVEHDAQIEDLGLKFSTMQDLVNKFNTIGDLANYTIWK